MMNFKNYFLLILIYLISFNVYSISRESKINIFLLMGLTRESGHWPSNTSFLLKQEFPNANIVFLDLPGSGKYYKMEAPKELADYVDVIRNDNIDILNNGLPNILIATSLAGMLGAQWAKVYPNDFSFLSLLSSSFAGICDLFGRAKISILPKLLKIYLSKDIEKRERMILSINSNKPIDDFILEKYIEIQKLRPMSDENIKNQTFAGKNFSFNEQISPKVLVLGSKKDPLVATSCLYKVANHFKAPLFLHPTSGHGLPIDALDWVINHVTKWLISN